MTEYKISDDGASETIEADDMRDAIAQAIESWQGGSWDGKCVISVRVAALDDDGEETGEVEWVDVECGDDPAEPECEHVDGHTWESPHSVVGGIDSNPGVWNKGGTTIVTREVCRHCGVYRRTTHYGSQRNPGQCDSVEYLPADECSIAYLSECAD